MTSETRPAGALPYTLLPLALAAGFLGLMLLTAAASGSSPPSPGEVAACEGACPEASSAPSGPEASRPEEKPPRVSGLVLGSSGVPLAGAGVELVPMVSSYESGLRRLRGLGPPPPVAAVRTDSRGRYELEPGDGGVFRLVARAEGRAPVQYFPLVLLEPIELPPVSPPPAERVEARLDGSGSRPLEGVWVFGQGSPSGGWGTAGWRLAFRLGRTGADGTVGLPRLPGETLTVTAFPPAAPPVSADAGGDGRVWLRATGRSVQRTMQVVEEDGAPVVGALIRSGELAWPAGVTGQDGRLDLVLPTKAAPSVRVYAPDGRHQQLRWATGNQRERKAILPRSIHLEGRILAAEDLRPLSGVLVWQGADPGAWTRTDAQGRYRLVPTGQESLWLQAEAPGRIPARHRLEAVDPARPRVPTLALERSVGMEVRVVDGGGSPLEGARLVALRRSWATRGFVRPDRADSRGFSRSDGGFALGALEADRAYSLVASLPGYTSAVVELRAPPLDEPLPAREPALEGSPLPVPAAERDDEEVLLIALTDTRGAVGRVVDLEDRPVPDAEVVASMAGSRPLPPGHRGDPGSPGSVTVPEGDPFRGRSNAEGRFRIAELPSAEIDLRVRASGFAPAIVRGIPIPGPDAGTGRADADLGTLVLAPGARIEGRVVDGEGRGIPGAAIHALPHQVYPDLRVEKRLARRTPEATSDGEGRFVLDELSRSKPVDLLVVARGFLRGEARGVRAPPPEPVEVTLEPSASVHGWVLDAEDRPIEEAEIYLESRRMLADSEVEIQVGLPETFAATSDGTGFFEVQGVRPGPAVVQASARGFVTLDPLHLEVPEAGSSEELTLRLEQGSVLEGTVTSSDEEPLAGVRIAIGDASAISDADGVYRVEGVAEGPATAEAYHPRYEKQRQEVEVAAGRNLLDWTLPTGARIEGRVVDGAGEPVAGARVFLDRRQRGYRQQRQQTGADGRFDFHPVADGRFDLWAELPGHAPAEYPAPLEVAGRDLEDLELRLEPGASLRGQVLGLEFDQLSGVEVVTFRSEEERAWRAKLDYQGFYEVVDLPAGDYLVRAELRAGHRQVEARVSLEPPEEVRRDLRFDARLSFSGRVLLDEEPLAGA
ncbi:MAG: carboxypeptidase-like regulatory domain-containing protein, partial [Holophagales bacterium]|nr:carboxypeptidase-like regulatory domain-containing protein [Holophagales bacterium]